LQPLDQMIPRKFRAGFLFFFLLSGLALVAGPMPGSALAGDRPSDSGERMPVLFKDWTEISELPDGAVRLQQEQERQGEYFRRWKAVHELVGDQHTSRLAQALLAKRGLGPALLEGGSDKMGRAFDGIDTLNVLIVRISFETNREPNLTTIMPDGDFDLSTVGNPDDLLVDPPPHNRQFYESHRDGLKEYYDYQSGGRLFIQGTVLPEDPNESYKLTDVADYGPGNDGWWTLESLERLVRDMIDAGDAGTFGSEFDFSDYDDDHPFNYIIFVHSGSDWQSDVNGDSPNDIPTFFVALGEPHNLVSGGQLSECSIIPETTSQDGFLGSIAAAFYHEFGHALGLVDIYNTTTGYPSVGIWDLMDSGTNLPVTLGHWTEEDSLIIKTATGVLPPSLSVWNKWFLGWVKMQEVDGRETDYRLPAVQVPYEQYRDWRVIDSDFNPDLPQAIRVGASPREYFLLENRYVPPAPSVADGTYTPYLRLAFERHEETKVIQYLAGEVSEGVWVNSGMYDYFMPEGGVLVWHVNMDRISANLQENTINALGDGLRLVEADGIQDIGVLDAYVLGWYGSDRDPFSAYSGGQNLFTDGSPSSRNFDKSWSGVRLSDIRANSTFSKSVMRFSGSVEPLVPGFPWEVASVTAAEASAADGNAGPRKLVASSMTPVQLGNDHVMVFSDDAGENWGDSDFPASLFALRSDGTPLRTASLGRPEGFILALDSPLVGPPLVLDPDALNPRLVYGTRNGTLGCLELTQDGDVVPIWNIRAGQTLLHAPVAGIGDDLLPLVMCAVAPDSLVFFEAENNGARAFAWELPSVLIAQPRSFAASTTPSIDPVGQLVLPLAAGLALTSFTSATYDPWGWDWPRETEGPVQTVVVPSTEGGNVRAFDDNGYLPAQPTNDRFPQELVGLNVPLVCEPASADLDADGNADLILATAERIFAYHADGVPMRGFPCQLYDLFPLPDTTRITGPLIVADASGDGVNEIFFNTTEGHLMGLSSTGELLSSLPFRWGDEGTGGLAMGRDSADNNLLWMISPGSYATEPFGRNHVNGRIVAYGLGFAADADVLTSRWLGTMGGVGRTGSVGESKHLESLSPLNVEMDRVIMYPNPVHESDMTVRFYAHAQGQASFTLYNLQGEEVLKSDFATTADSINEDRLDVSGLVSGLYLGRLIYPGKNGTQTKTMTLAVER
jgi:M6 family metalloprotease-like protein